VWVSGRLAHIAVRRLIDQALTKDEARRIAVNISEPPELLRRERR
jgi:hypothetical protein